MFWPSFGVFNRIKPRRNPLKLPPGLSEREVLDAIERTVHLLAGKFVFGMYSVEDIEQEGRMEAVRILARYDASRPLDNYLYSCVRNFYLRLQRDKLRRTADPPCRLCHEAEGGRPPHEGGWCPKYLAWRERNDAKANLMQPLDIEHGEEPRSRSDSEVEESVELKDLLARIDERLDVELRADYLQMKAGRPVPRPRRLAVENAVRTILGEDLEETAAKPW